MQVIEFSEVLKYYWVDMYGYELNYKQACPAFNDMLQHLDVERDHPTATIYFSHSGTLLKMLAHLGLYKVDKRMTHDDYEIIRKSNYSIGKIDPFANNLSFVSFK